MRKILLIMSALFLASFLFSACGDETYSTINDSKEVIFLADNMDQSIANRT